MAEFSKLNGYDVKDRIARSRTSTLENELAIQTVRIDSIASLPEGSTSGDAEIIDARLGVDGFTYDNLGNAIRYSELMNRNTLMSIDTINYSDPFIPLFENGNANLSSSGWSYVNELYGYRCRTPENYVIRVHYGDKLTCLDWSKARCYIGFRNLDGTYKSGTNWITADYTFTEDAYIGLLIQRLESGQFTNPLSICSLFRIVPAPKYYDNDDLIDYNKLEYGLLNTGTGLITIGNLNNRDVTSEYIEVDSNTIYTILIKQTLNNQQYYCNWCFYDVNKEYISGSSKYGNFSGNLSMKVNITTPETCKYLRVALRTRINGEYHLFKGNTNNFKLNKWYFDNVNYDYTNNFNIKSIAHAGNGNNSAPENTLIAYIKSFKNGFKFVECDLRMTADNIPVLLHDATIDRTSDGTGNVADMTFQQLQQYDFGSYAGAEYAGTKIPSFEEFIKLCKELSLYVYAEYHSFTKEQCEIIDNLIRKYDMVDHTTVMSFNFTDLIYERQFNPNIRLGFLIDDNNFTSWKDVINRINLLKTNNNTLIVVARTHVVDEEHSAYMTDIDVMIENNIPIDLWLVQNVNQYNMTNKYHANYASGFVTIKKPYHEYMADKYNS